ncbi:MAG TPA: M1 family aminopeptidase [Bryobacteraceae bacterium]|nr:M1 family aminopeptidase [Bryobacteraceae bacterium]
MVVPFLISVVFAAPPTAADLVNEIQQLSVDAAQTYKVRDLQISRGGVKLYLSEGVLSFLTPISGQIVGAVFTTQDVEAGDGEILAFPPNRAERASLAGFIKSPNLDEHFSSALLLFTDGTEAELREQIQQRPVHQVSDAAAKLKPEWESVVRRVAAGFNLHLIGSLLDGHPPAQGFFYAIVSARNLGPIDFTYQPEQSETVSLGRPVADKSGNSGYQLWTQYRPTHAPTQPPPVATIDDYRIETEIRPDLSLASVAKIRLSVARNTRAVSLGLSERLHIGSATINGQPAEVLQSDGRIESTPVPEDRRLPIFLLVSQSGLNAGKSYEVELRYEGSVISKTANGSYYVSDRNAWFPHAGPTFATFDLTFRCPEALRLVSTGELISDEVVKGVRTVHRRSLNLERFAGFNLGEYVSASQQRGPYRIECDANRGFSLFPKLDGQGLITLATNPEGNEDSSIQAILQQTGDLLEAYGRRWGALPIHDVVVSPIPGYFGQGFPGLIYLSTVSYVMEADRPEALRTPAIDAFFSDMLLPHETAHQWWGNIVSAADYRADWLMEAMASESALEVLEQTKGPAAVAQVLGLYKTDLAEEHNGHTTESAGPVDFGYRLEDSAGRRAWQVITYEKGAWILWMLRKRMGSDAFTKMQAALLQRFHNQPITNEEFRKVASEFLPPQSPDHSLQRFFETWVSSTGFPALTLKTDAKNHESGLEMGAVDDDFQADIPLSCTDTNGTSTTYWVRASTGSNSVEPPSGVSRCQLPSSDSFLYRRYQFRR